MRLSILCEHPPHYFPTDSFRRAGVIRGPNWLYKNSSRSDKIGNKVIKENALDKAVSYARFLVKQKHKPYAIAISDAASQFDLSTKEISNKLNPPKLQIIWTVPDFIKETDEYFDNDPTRRFLAKMGYGFENESELINFLKNGQLKKISRETLAIVPSENITTDPHSFQKELEDPEYRESYDRMKSKLFTQKQIQMHAPIIIKFPNTYYGFAGNRRSNLAWVYGIDVKFWVVKAEDKSPKQQTLFTP